MSAITIDFTDAATYTAALAAHYPTAEESKEDGPSKEKCPGGPNHSQHPVKPTDWTIGPSAPASPISKKDFKRRITAFPSPTDPSVNLTMDDIKDPLAVSLGNMTVQDVREYGNAWASALKPPFVPFEPNTSDPLRDGERFQANLFFTNGILTGAAGAFEMSQRLASLFGGTCRTLWNTFEKLNDDVAVNGLLPLLTSGSLRWTGPSPQLLWKDLAAQLLKTGSVQGAVTQLTQDVAVLGAELRETAYDHAWIFSADDDPNEPFRYRELLGATDGGAQEVLRWMAVLFTAWQQGADGAGQPSGPQTRLGIIGTSHGTLVTAKSVIAFANAFPEAIPWMKGNVRLLHAGCCVPHQRYPLLRALLETYEPHSDPRDPFSVLLGDHDRTELRDFYKTSPLYHLTPPPQEHTVAGGVDALDPVPRTGKYQDTLEWLCETASKVLARPNPLDIVPALTRYHNIMRGYAREDERHFRKKFFGPVTYRYWPDVVAFETNSELVRFTTKWQAPGVTLQDAAEQVTDDEARKQHCTISRLELLRQAPNLIDNNPDLLTADPSSVVTGRVDFHASVIGVRCDATSGAPLLTSVPEGFLDTRPVPKLPVPDFLGPTRSMDRPHDVVVGALCPDRAGFGLNFEVVTDEATHRIRAWLFAPGERGQKLATGKGVARRTLVHTERVAGPGDGPLVRVGISEEQGSLHPGDRRLWCAFDAGVLRRGTAGQVTNPLAAVTHTDPTTNDDLRSRTDMWHDQDEDETLVEVHLDADNAGDWYLRVDPFGIELDVELTSAGAARWLIAIPGDHTDVTPTTTAITGPGVSPW